MDSIVLMKQVPDLVEELEIGEDGKDLDRAGLRYMLNEFDDHALEQALIFKEQHSGQVKVFALDTGDVDESLFTALAKGADSATKITGNFEKGASSHAAAHIYKALLKETSFDLVLTGVQAIDDLDGQVGAMTASLLGLPYVGVVSGVLIDEGQRSAVVKKEYPGGLLAELSVQLPAVLGIQAATHPPRYVPVARIRQAMKTARIDEVEVPEMEESTPSTGFRVRRMQKPEVGDGAQMLDGDMEDVVGRIVRVLTEKGLVR